MKIFTTLFCSVLLFTVQAQIKGTATFNGSIENPLSDNVTLLDKNGGALAEFALDGNYAFTGTAEIETGYYSLKHGSESTKIYVVAGDVLTMSLNTAMFDETVKYTGTHANENNYLAQAYLLDENLGQLNYYGYYAKLDENAFLKLNDSVYNLKFDHLKNAGKLDAEFAYLEQKTLEFNQLDQIASYQSMHRYVTKNQDFVVSASYPDPFKNINFTDENQLKITAYFILCESYFSDLLDKQTDQKEDFYVRWLKLVDEKIGNKSIKEAVLFSTASHYINTTENLDGFYRTFVKLSTNEEHIKEITTQYNLLKKIDRGQASPNFNFKTIDGKSVALTDLRGKIVYIDVWATWCQPCLGEIPSLKKLEEELREENIAFVSICAFDQEVRWRKMVPEKNLQGIQLYCENKDDAFLTGYMITGIPRFILIDAEGKIIDADADRPSNPDLKKQLMTLLGK